MRAFAANAAADDASRSGDTAGPGRTVTRRSTAPTLAVAGTTGEAGGTGDLVTALLAVAALFLLLRRSEHALFVTTLMNVVGLLDIIVSESWIGYLELHGHVARGAFIHGPSVGAALYSALHLYAFYFIARAAAARAPATS